MADMVFLTKLKPEPMGTYNASTAYGINSLVMSEDGAAAYLSVKDVPAGTPLTDTSYWKIHTDLSLVKQNAEEAAEKAMAARAELIEIARNLTNPVEAEGNPVQAELVGGLPFDNLATVLEPKRAGSGEAAPDNIRPISGWTGAKLTRTGKNLFSGSSLDITNAGITVKGGCGSEVTLYGTATATMSIPAFAVELPAGIYSFSVGEIGNINRFEPTIDGAAKTQLRSGGKWSFTLDTPATVGLNAIISNGANCGTEDNPTRVKVQLESGADATAYEPYQGEVCSADFGQTVYGGRLDWQKGVLTGIKGYKAFDGTEGWYAYSSAYPHLFALETADLGAYSGTQPDHVDCSHYPFDSGSLTGGETGCRFNTADTDGVVAARFYISDARFTNIANFTAYLAAQAAAGTPVQVVYKLAAPIEIPLTPQEIKQLEGTNTLYGDGSIAIIGRQRPDLALVSRIEALESAILNA